VVSHHIFFDQQFPVLNRYLPNLDQGHSKDNEGNYQGNNHNNEVEKERPPTLIWSVPNKSVANVCHHRNQSKQQEHEDPHFSASLKIFGLKSIEVFEFEGQLIVDVTKNDVG